jgi:CheY-like chemotaxis protein
MSSQIQVELTSADLAPDDGRDKGESGARLSVLIVDDDEISRVVLEIMLRRDGHVVHTAKNGDEALAQYEAVRPDLILMDIRMPVMDGYEATRRIKAVAGRHFVSIIFLTAPTDEMSLVNCLEVGGDDFLMKPVSGIILRAKLTAAARVHRHIQDLEWQARDLNIHHERLRYEHELAERVFAKIIGNHGGQAGNIRMELLPLAVTNGDLLLVERTPKGGQYVLLGDCTGHGLAAAIGAIPITDIFYAMTRKGFGLREIVVEMNRKLHAILPTGHFLAACMVEWDYASNQMEIWNGGVPDAFIVSNSGIVSARIPSRNIPLGIVGNEELTIHIETRQVSRGDRLYLYTDGLIEARDGEGLMFGEKRLEDLIASNRDRAGLFDEICAALGAFRGGQEQEDDITLVEVLCDKTLLKGEEAGSEELRPSPTYDLSVKLGPQSLRDFDPLSLVKALISGMAALDNHRSNLYTIIAELYANALEHGVLGLDCSLKSTPEGFAAYYMERERLLSCLKEGWIHISIECFAHDSGGELVLQMEDSGKGFDTNSVRWDVRCDGNTRISGRGIELVHALCKSLAYDFRGNYVRAVYVW